MLHAIAVLFFAAALAASAFVSLAAEFESGTHYTGMLYNTW